MTTEVKDTKTKEYKGTPISIDISEIDNGKGYWSSRKVVVRYDGNVIGEYIRSYPSFTEATFCPFKIGDEWYALYSKDYTASRVAKLTPTEFIDWCGEEADSMGFCPTEFFVPFQMKYTTTLTMQGQPKELEIDNWFDSDYGDENEFWKDVSEHPGCQIHWADYGFLTGCYWGDDGSWKLRYIELTGIPEKKLIITEKFGYWEMPDKIRKCIRIYGNGYMKLHGEFTMNMKSDIPNDLFKPEFFNGDLTS